MSEAPPQPPGEPFRLESDEPAERSARQSWVAPLVLVPLGLVAAAVALFLFMSWMVGSEAGPEDYLEEVVSGGYNARKQAFYDLMVALIERQRENRLADLPADFDDQVAAAFDRLEEDRAMERVALARSLVVLRSEHAYERVTRMVEEARASGGEVAGSTPLEWTGVVETRHLNPLAQGVLMLGDLGDPRATALLVELLASADPGIRMAAAFALGGSGSAEARAPLREALEDEDREVRRNAALALARHADRAGLSVLIDMLNPDSYEGYRTGALQLAAMGQALAALRELRADEARPAVEALIARRPRLDPDLVSAAMRWLAAAEAGWPEG